MIKQLNLLYRKLMFYFSKKDIDAIIKYDPLDILQEREINDYEWQYWLYRNSQSIWTRR